MIPHIEGPRDDEPLTSMLGRSLDIAPTFNRGRIGEYFFGKHGSRPHVGFPRGLSFLTRTFGTKIGLTADEIIERTTMLPLLRPFLSIDEHNRIVAAMKTDRETPAWLHPPREHGGRLRPLQFCARCRNVDRLRYGYTWWRRSHQVEGVQLCAIHGLPLCPSQFSNSGNWKNDYPLADDAESVITVVPSDKPSQLSRFISCQVYWLLNTPTPVLGRAILRDVYMAALDEMDFLKNRRLCRRDFLHSFHAKYGHECLATQGLDFDPKHPFAWPATITLGKSNEHRPIKHLYLMYFLGLSAAEIVNRARNPKRPPHRVSCRGPGDAQEMLRCLWMDPSLSIAEIARRLKRPESTITTWATGLGLPHPRFASVMRRTAFKKERKEFRIEWLALRNCKFSPGRHRARRWLKAHDAKWFQLSLKRSKNPRALCSIDWSARDREYSRRVIQNAAQIRDQRPFRRINEFALCEGLKGRESVWLNRHRYRRTNQAIRQLVESPRAFILRKIAAIRCSRPDVPAWRVRELACARTVTDSEVLRALGYSHFKGKLLKES